MDFPFCHHQPPCVKSVRIVVAAVCFTNTVEPQPSEFLSLPLWRQLHRDSEDSNAKNCEDYSYSRSKTCGHPTRDLPVAHVPAPRCWGCLSRKEYPAELDTAAPGKGSWAPRQLWEYLVWKPEPCQSRRPQAQWVHTCLWPHIIPSPGGLTAGLRVTGLLLCSCRVSELCHLPSRAATSTSGSKTLLRYRRSLTLDGPSVGHKVHTEKYKYVQHSKYIMQVGGARSLADLCVCLPLSLERPSGRARPCSLLCPLSFSMFLSTFVTTTSQTTWWCLGALWLLLFRQLFHCAPPRSHKPSDSLTPETAPARVSSFLTNYALGSKPTKALGCTRLRGHEELQAPSSSLCLPAQLLTAVSLSNSGVGALMQRWGVV